MWLLGTHADSEEVNQSIWFTNTAMTRKSIKAELDYWFKYGFKAYATRFYLIAITLVAVYMAYYIIEQDRALEDFMLIRNACPGEMRIEARAEHIFWGKASKLVFSCI